MKIDPSPRTAVEMKAELLSHGIQPTPACLQAYGPPNLRKRRAYGNPDDPAFRDHDLPQELYLLPENLICAVNVRAGSPWRLDYEEGEFGIRHVQEKTWVRVTFPKQPSFYVATLSDGRPARTFITLYGGGSLGVFVYGHCALVDRGMACHYCSIAPNRAQEREFPHVISPTKLREALILALEDADCPIRQVMINGGNFPDANRSFAYYCDIVEAARMAIADSGRGGIALHLIVYPPEDLRLLHRLRGLDVSVAMNTEVFDPVLFEKFCPGKHAASGQGHLFEALAAAVEALGFGKVYSIVVGGLEPMASLGQGLRFLAGRGVIPVLNVFHADPYTPLSRHPAPTPEQILEMGRSLQSIYGRLENMIPFYEDCGRNSLDTEAHRGLFLPETAAPMGRI